MKRCINHTEKDLDRCKFCHLLDKLIRNIIVVIQNHTTTITPYRHHPTTHLQRIPHRTANINVKQNLFLTNDLTRLMRINCPIMHQRIRNGNAKAILRRQTKKLILIKINTTMNPIFPMTDFSHRNVIVHHRKIIIQL